ncbi:MAG: glycosyltransferase family 25 protein [Paracoccaceae bacterium]
MEAAGFVIHLARAEARRGHVAALRRQSPVPVQVIDAVDGATLDEAVVRAVYQPHDLLAPRYPFAISRGEIGCFLSHRKAWQAILDNGADAGLVFEDDVVLDPDVFPRAVEAVLGWMGRGDWVEFQTRPVSGALIHEAEGFRIFEPEIPPVRLSAQLIGAEAAARMLAVTERFDRPVDGVVQLLGVTGQRILCVEPSGVRDDTAAAGGTTIQKKGAALWGQVGKSWHRAAYRRAIRAHVAGARARMDQRV